jgi:spermidine/putrescine ABC transporter ATP-binding subunit
MEQSPDASPSIEIREITKRFGEFVAVHDVSLDIRRGEFFSLLGPSGCGKTTLLRMIAGLETPTAGQLMLSGRDVTQVPAYRRPVHLVFQHFALFPHLTVERNVAFGLRYHGDVPRREYADRVAGALDLVRLSGLGRRYPNELSGGQKQRVALARALVLRPQVLLLDEPLGALDQKLRKEMQVELKTLQRELGITFVFVTHDQEEAMTMSDRIAVMNKGKVEQCDDAEVVFEYPRTEFVAGFVGAANFFAGTVARVVDADHAEVRAAAGFCARVPLRGRAATAGDPARFLVRPEKLSLSSSPPTGQCCMQATVEQRVYQGLSTVYTLRNAAGEAFTVYEQNTRPYDASAAPAGQTVYACWDERHAMLID